MKKFLALLTAIIATLVCFSACGSCVSDNDNSSSSSSGGNEPPVLTKRTADGEIAYIFDEYEGFSYDAPSVIKDGNDVIVAYTTNKTQNKEDKIKPRLSMDASGQARFSLFCGLDEASQPVSSALVYVISGKSQTVRRKFTSPQW